MNYIAYYRTSTSKQQLGIVAQRNAVLNFINTDSSNKLIAEFEEKESGKNNNRKALVEAINECKQKKCKISDF